METNKPLVVVVDDDQKNLDVLTEALARKGYEIHTALNLADARRLIRQVTPNLLILDRNLPDGDGLQLCKEIREDSRRSHWPILFLSVRNQVDEMVLGLKTGADDYLPKPFGMVELEARVMAIIRRSFPHLELPKPAAKKPKTKKAVKNKAKKAVRRK